MPADAIKEEETTKLRRIKASQITKESTESVDAFCKPVLSEIEYLCQSNDNIKEPITTDTIEFRKFLASEFIKFYQEQLPDYDEILNETILYSFNYYTCAQEKYEKPLKDASGEIIEPAEKAFLQSQCGSKGKSKAEYAIPKSHFFSSEYTNISISDQEVEEIERNAKRYLESDEGKKAVAKAYRDAGLEVPKRYTADSTSTSPEKVVESKPQGDSLGQNNDYTQPSDIFTTDVAAKTEPIGDQNKEINSQIKENNKKFKARQKKKKNLKISLRKTFPTLFR